MGGDGQGQRCDREGNTSISGGWPAGSLNWPAQHQGRGHIWAGRGEGRVLSRRGAQWERGGGGAVLRGAVCSLSLQQVAGQRKREGVTVSSLGSDIQVQEHECGPVGGVRPGTPVRRVTAEAEGGRSRRPCRCASIGKAAFRGDGSARRGRCVSRESLSVPLGAPAHCFPILLESWNCVSNGRPSAQPREPQRRPAAVGDAALRDKRGHDHGREVSPRLQP